MNKKHFLFLLPVCLVFCVSLTTCEEAPVTDLWDKLRNTAWSIEKTYAEGMGEWFPTYQFGFYGPNNGPRPGNYSTPYVVYRCFAKGNIPSWWVDSGGIVYLGMQINSTGTRLSIGSGSFKVSVSNNGEKMTISRAVWGDQWNSERISGTYTKISSDPNYNWNDNNGIFELGYFTSYNADTQRGWCSDGTDGVATNLSIDYLVSAKYLVLELDTVPTGGLQLIWQGNSDGWRWDQADDILDSDGNPNAAKGSILNGNKLTIELSKALKNYDDFVESSMAKILLGYYSPDIEGLGVIKAYLLYE